MTNATILVIDDDETILSIVEATLKKHGFTPITAANGEEGITKAANQNPDAIILDQNMPGMSGNETLTKLKEQPNTQNTPIIMLTGENDVLSVSKSLELGAQDYIVKPFDETNFIIRLNNLLKRR